VRYRSLLVILLVSLMVSPVLTAEKTGDEIIRKVDANMTFDTARFQSEMVIYIGEEVRRKTFVSYAKGRTNSFTEFLSPPRDKGVKYLKIEDNMWMYLPSVEKIIKIAGHMLRQSMMGSDFSYEDALESAKLLEKYQAELVSEEVLEDSPCYVIDLTARVKEVTYYRRRIWVDKNLFIPLKEELFAVSGKKLKVMTLGNMKKFGTRFYPTYMVMRDLLRKNSKTEMIISKVEFDLKIPEEIFTQRSLKK